MQKITDISEIIDEMDDTDIWQILVDGDTYADTTNEILNNLVNEKKMPGVYISLNIPYDVVKKKLEKIIDIRWLIFIDGITNLTGVKPQKKEGCLFLSSLTNLTDMGLTIDQALDAINSDKIFILLDSLSTMTVYNDDDVVFKFMHYLMGRIRMKGISGIFITIKLDKGNDITKQLSLICDKTIEVQR